MIFIFWWIFGIAYCLSLFISYNKPGVKLDLDTFIASLFLGLAGPLLLIEFFTRGEKDD
jgi:hypothetical protein